jgi:hypothetical protein
MTSQINSTFQNVLPEGGISCSPTKETPVVLQRKAPQQRLLIRFDDPSNIEAKKFEINGDIEPLEYQSPRSRIPKGNDKATKEIMMYYVQYTLHQFQTASNLFTSFAVNGDTVTVVFNCPSGFSVAYDFRLYCAGDWMLTDTNIAKSYHFATWGDLDFAILYMLQYARNMISTTFHQPLTPSNWGEEKGILVFVEPPQKENINRSNDSSSSDTPRHSHKNRRQHNSTDDDSSDNSDNSESEDEKPRKHSKKSKTKSKGKSRK